MDKKEKERILREAVLSLDPQKIREAGEKTGHPVRIINDEEIMFLAAQIIMFYIPDAPYNAREEAMMILGIKGMFFGGF